MYRPLTHWNRTCTPDTGARGIRRPQRDRHLGFKTLTSGQPVAFTVADTGRGPEATRVVPYTRTTRPSRRAAPALVTGCAGLDAATTHRDPVRLPVAVWQRAVPLPCASRTWNSIAMPHPHR